MRLIMIELEVDSGLLVKAPHDVLNRLSVIVMNERNRCMEDMVNRPCSMKGQTATRRGMVESVNTSAATARVRLNSSSVKTIPVDKLTPC